MQTESIEYKNPNNFPPTYLRCVIKNKYPIVFPTIELNEILHFTTCTNADTLQKDYYVYYDYPNRKSKRFLRKDFLRLFKEI